MLPTRPEGSGRGKFVLGGLFVLAMAGIWAAAAWFARGDRRFREHTSAAKFDLPAGQSLNDLKLPTADMSMKREVSGDRCQVSDETSNTDT